MPNLEFLGCSELLITPTDAVIHAQGSCPPYFSFWLARCLQSPSKKANKKVLQGCHPLSPLGLSVCPQPGSLKSHLVRVVGQPGASKT